MGSVWCSVSAVHEPSSRMIPRPYPTLLLFTKTDDEPTSLTPGRNDAGSPAPGPKPPRLAPNHHAGHQPPRHAWWCTPRAAVRTRPNTPLDNSRGKDYIHGYHGTTTAGGAQPDQAVRES